MAARARARHRRGHGVHRRARGAAKNTIPRRSRRRTRASWRRARSGARRRRRADPAGRSGLPARLSDRGERRPRPRRHERPRSNGDRELRVYAKRELDIGATATDLAAPTRRRSRPRIALMGSLLPMRTATSAPRGSRSAIAARPITSGPISRDRSCRLVPPFPRTRRPTSDRSSSRGRR